MVMDEVVTGMPMLVAEFFNIRCVQSWIDARYFFRAWVGGLCNSLRIYATLGGEENFGMDAFIREIMLCGFVFCRSC